MNNLTQAATTRQCGNCQLCCKLLPMTPRNSFSPELIDASIRYGLLTRQDAARAEPDFPKPAGHRCKHQRHGQGCNIYSRRPLGCRFWNCRWLVNDDTADLRRPDRSHYVIDIATDYVTHGIKGEEAHVTPVIQIWVDPDYPDAHRDPALRAYIERRAAEGVSALVRYNEKDAMLIVAPCMSMDGQWHELRPTGLDTNPHTPQERAKNIGQWWLNLEKEERDDTDRDTVASD